MRHWHRCQRWWGRREACPFERMKEHQPDEGEPPDDLVDAPRLFAIPEKREAQASADPGVEEPLGAFGGQLPLPFPFPIPEPQDVPQLPGFPAFRPWPQDPLPGPATLPGQPALPDPGAPRFPQPVAEGAANLVRGAQQMVPQGWRPTQAQLVELFGAFKARGDDPVVDERAASYAVAEQAVANVVRNERVTKKRLAAPAAATAAGIGAAAVVHKGGFGGLQGNMSAEIARLTQRVGARKLREDESGGEVGTGFEAGGPE